MRKIKKEIGVFREKQQKLRMGYAVIILIFLCTVSDRVYRQADDWSRTLRYNYDFSGSNRYVHTVYLGCSDISLPQTGEIQGEGNPGRRESCDLRSRGQSFGDSCFLLRQADRRYALQTVCLVLDGCRSEREYEEEGFTLTEEEEKDLRRLMWYCEKEEIVLMFLDAGRCADESDPQTVRTAYAKQIREIAESTGCAFCDWVWVTLL